MEETVRPFLRAKMESAGTISGNAISWSITRETQRGTFTMTYKGEVSGDSMQGIVAFGEICSGEWTAKRQ